MDKLDNTTLSALLAGFISGIALVIAAQIMKALGVSDE